MRRHVTAKGTGLSKREDSKLKTCNFKAGSCSPLMQPFGFAYDFTDMPRIVAVHTLDREEEKAKDRCTVLEIFTRESLRTKNEGRSYIWPRFEMHQDSIGLFNFAGTSLNNSPKKEKIEPFNEQKYYQCMFNENQIQQNPKSCCQMSQLKYSNERCTEYSSKWWNDDQIHTASLSEDEQEIWEEVDYEDLPLSNSKIHCQKIKSLRWDNDNHQPTRKSCCISEEDELELQRRQSRKSAAQYITLDFSMNFLTDHECKFSNKEEIDSERFHGNLGNIDWERKFASESDDPSFQWSLIPERKNSYKTINVSRTDSDVSNDILLDKIEQEHLFENNLTQENSEIKENRFEENIKQSWHHKTKHSRKSVACRPVKRCMKIKIEK